MVDQGKGGSHISVGGQGRSEPEPATAPTVPAPPGCEPSLPHPEPSPAGLFGGHHVRKWLPAKHRRPRARGAMPGLVRRNACKMLVESSARLSRTVVRRIFYKRFTSASPDMR